MHAQQNAVLSPALCQSSLHDDINAACQDFVMCADGNNWVSDCYDTLFEDVLALCGDPLCDRDILLNLALLSASIDHYYEWVDTPQFQNQMAFFLREIQLNHHDVAATAFADAFEVYPHRHLAYAAALADEQANLVDDAFMMYAAAQATQFYTPLVYYSRGYLYLDQGDEERASRDFHTFNALQSDATYLAHLSAPPSLTDYALDDPDTAMLYPLATHGVSPGGDRTRYQFTLAGEPIELMWLDERATLAIRDLLGTGLWSLSLPDVLFFDCEAGTCHEALNFQETYPGLTVGGTAITLTWRDDGSATLEMWHEGSESGLWALSVLMPETADDPRPTITCASGVYPRFSPGDEISPVTQWQPVIFYPSAGADPDSGMPLNDRQLTVSGDVVCGDEDNWWPVTLADGREGWVREAPDGVYQFTTRDLRGKPTIAALLALPSR